MSSSTEPVHETDSDPGAALMREVGVQFKQVREERGEDLEAVAEALRIKAVYLQAIEEGDLSVMPGRAYALGFLRSYADYLGFDGDDLIEQIRNIVENLTDRTRLEMKTPLHESRVPKAPVIVLSVAMLAGIYVGWTFLQGGDGRPDEVVAEVPENLNSIAVGALPESEPVDRPDTSPAGATEDVAALEQAAGEPAEPAAAPAPDELPTAASEPSPASEPPAIIDTPATAAITAEDGTPANNVLPRTADRQSSGLEAQRPGAIGPAPSSAPGDDRALAEVAPQAGPEPAAGPIEPAAPEPTLSERLAPVEPAPPVAIPEPQAATLPAPAPESPATGAQPGSSDRLQPDGDRQTETTAVEALPAVAPASSPAAPATAAEVVAELRQAGSGVAARPVDAGPPVVMEEINQDARVVLRALDTSWIQITSESGDYLRSRTLQPGDIFLVPNRDDLALWTGNAGGLELIVDGRRIPPLGEPGTVVRNVSLAPAALRPSGAPAAG